MAFAGIPQKQDEVASRACPSGLTMYLTNSSARSGFSDPSTTPMDWAQRTAPSFGIVQVSSGCSSARTAVSHSPPPTTMSTSPVASAVCAATTPATEAARDRIVESAPPMAARLSAVIPAVGMPSAIAARPITGR